MNIIYYYYHYHHYYLLLWFIIICFYLLLSMIVIIIYLFRIQNHATIASQTRLELVSKTPLKPLLAEDLTNMTLRTFDKCIIPAHDLLLLCIFNTKPLNNVVSIASQIRLENAPKSVETPSKPPFPNHRSHNTF